ncbi:hypothetical protein M192_gp082 [Halorubrum tailed phage 8]|uniref:Uncharacterized protein n=1 Tax=Halorubrum tailed phage 8 TaxID=2847109 RepID=R4TJI2_9CAUD|nr:hypothetical protein M192_gp082 [Halorubrum tailed phage 8]AGM10797.1 hypothetical protein HRTV8_51 [Halorubrum tailed phage 8]UBF19376.1 hypothetical protein HRTV-19_gp50 [Halorubrum virus HRTV-19]UBF19505.1 hypothetical protein HRTV-23_gp50 [Halorubrum virus HRTV-23]
MSELTDEQEEWARGLRVRIISLEEAAALVEGKLDEMLDGDLSYAEYEEWVDAHEDDLEALQL